MTWFHFVKGGRSTLERWDEKIAKRTGSGPSALHGRISFAPRPIFIRSLAELLGFDFLRKSRKILSFGAVNFYPHIIASRQIGQVHKKINREREI